MKYGLAKKIKKREPKYMPQLDIEELNSTEKNLYNIVQTYAQTQEAMENIPKQQRPIIYKTLATVCANLSKQMEKQNNYKNEANLFKILAVTYAQNAINYSKAIESNAAKMNAVKYD